MCTEKREDNYWISRRACLLAVVSFLYLTTMSIATTYGDGSGWHNSNNPLDTTGDEFFALDDVLAITNALEDPFYRSGENDMLPSVATPPPFVDVVPNCVLSPIDLVNVVNAVNNDDAFIAGPQPSIDPLPSDVFVSLRVTDLDGNVIDETNVGSTVLLVATAEDRADGSVGVFASYFDLQFDPAMLSVDGDPEFGFGAATNPGVATTGEIAGIGGARRNFFDPGKEEFVVAVPFLATQIGQANFTGDNGAALVYDQYDWFAPQFVGATLTVVPEPSCGALLAPLLLFFIQRPHRRPR